MENELKDSFTDAQRKIIKECIKDGFGTMLFAQSVRKSGKCSEKQYETMVRLHEQACYRVAQWEHDRKHRPKRKGPYSHLSEFDGEYDESGYL